MVLDLISSASVGCGTLAGFFVLIITAGVFVMVP